MAIPSSFGATAQVLWVISCPGGRLPKCTAKQHGHVAVCDFEERVFSKSLSWSILFFFSAKLEAGVDVTPATPWISRFQSLLLIPNFQSWIIPVEMSYIFKAGRFPSLMLKNLGVLLLQQTLLLLVQPLKPHFSCLGMTHPHIPFTHMYIYIYIK